MSAVVFIDVVQAGPRAEEVVASLKRTVPASFVGVAGTERIEVFFGAPGIDADAARRELVDAIAKCGEGAGEHVAVVS